MVFLYAFQFRLLDAAKPVDRRCTWRRHSSHRVPRRSFRATVTLRGARIARGCDERGGVEDESRTVCRRIDAERPPLLASVITAFGVTSLPFLQWSDGGSARECLDSCSIEPHVEIAGPSFLDTPSPHPPRPFARSSVLTASDPPRSDRYQASSLARTHRGSLVRLGYVRSRGSLSTLAASPNSSRSAAAAFGCH